MGKYDVEFKRVPLYSKSRKSEFVAVQTGSRKDAERWRRTLRKDSTVVKGSIKILKGGDKMAKKRHRVKSHMRKVKGRKTKVRVKSHMR